ncbi:Uncharacterised protein [Bordetella pertussis]|nr:Uncharacterised protein [Bordetella pertussis]
MPASAIVPVRLTFLGNRATASRAEPANASPRSGRGPLT